MSMIPCTGIQYVILRSVDSTLFLVALTDAYLLLGLDSNTLVSGMAICGAEFPAPCLELGLPRADAGV